MLNVTVERRSTRHRLPQVHKCQAFSANGLWVSCSKVVASSPPPTPSLQAPSLDFCCIHMYGDQWLANIHDDKVRRFTDPPCGCTLCTGSCAGDGRRAASLCDLRRRCHRQAGAAWMAGHSNASHCAEAPFTHCTDS